MKGIIYKATNTFNGKVYIGQTVAGLPKRRQQHYRDAKADSENIFHLALYQYPNAFEWETIDTFSGPQEFVIHSLNVAEEYHILKYKSTDERHGYNATGGGYSSDKFAEHIKARAQAAGGTAKAILQYDREGIFVQEFPSINAVAAYLEKDKIHLHVLTSGLHYGYQWRVKRNEYYPRKIQEYIQPQKTSVAVVVYDSRGEFLGKFPCAKVARLKIGSNSRVREFTERLEVLEHLEKEYYIFKKPEGECPARIEIAVKRKIKKEPKSSNKRVASYTLDGDFIRAYESIREASGDTESGTKSIVKACNEPLPIVLGPTSKRKYNWRFYEGNPPTKINVVNLRPEKVEKMVWKLQSDGTKKQVAVLITKSKAEQYKKKMEHRIIQYSLEGEFIKVWNNAYQAASSGADSQALIRKELKGEPTKKELNYQWRYYSPNYPKNIGQKILCKAPKNEKRPDDKIEELDRMGNVVATYSGTGEAAKKSGVSQSYICNILAGKVSHPKRRFRRASA